MTYVLPVFSTLLGILVLGEELHWYEPVGALVVLAGIAVSQGGAPWRSPRSRGPRGLRGLLTRR